MKVKIVDFLMTMSGICSSHTDCDNCPFYSEEYTEYDIENERGKIHRKVRGCISDSMDYKPHAEIVKKIVLKRMKRKRAWNLRLKK